MLGTFGFTVVTGGQVGIDYAASLGVVRSGGRLILVLPWDGFNRVLLRPIMEHRGTEVIVIDEGGTPSDKLVARTRKVVEIGDVLVVPEARGSGRGTFLATRHALELGKTVYVLEPCTTNDDVVDGYRRLTRMGAKSVRNVQELLELLGRG